MKNIKNLSLLIRQLLLLLTLVLFLCFKQNTYGQDYLKTDSLLIALKQMPDDTNKVNILVDLTWEYKMSNPKIADILGNMGYDLAKKMNYEKGIAYAAKNLANVYYYQSDFYEAFLLYKESLNVFQKIKDKSGIAKSYRNMGNIYHFTGDWKQALDYYYKSLALRKEIGDKNGIAYIYNAIGLVYSVSGQEKKDTALKYCKNALAIQLELDHEFGIAQSYLRIGSIYYEKYIETNNDLIADTAISYLLKSREICEKIEDVRYIATIDETIGNIYLNQRLFNESYKYLTNSLKTITKLGNKYGMAESFKSLGSYYNTIENYKNAEIYFLKANRLSIEIGAKNIERDLAFKLSENCYMLNEFKTSIKYYQRYVILKDSLMNDEKIKEMTKLSMQHEFDKKQKFQEVEKQKNEALQQAKIKKQKTITYFIIAVFLLMIILTILIFRNYRNKLKANEQKNRFKEVFNAIEKERERITIDLHDSVGQMLSTTKLYLSGLEDAVGLQNDESQMYYTEAINLLDGSLSELRNILYNIMPDSLITQGLKTAVNEMISKISKVSGIIFKIKLDEYNMKQNETLDIAIYRIIQEVLNNILKHARATEVDLIMISKTEKINLIISDNGIGMENFDLYKNKGIGWKSILSRVQMLNGKILINTGINEGTKIDIMIPV